MNGSPIVVDESWVLFSITGQLYIGKLVEPGTTTKASGSEGETEGETENPSEAEQPEETEDILTFCPLYSVAMSQTPQGLMIAAIPFGLMSGISPVTVEHADLFVSFGAMSTGDVEMYRDMVREAEKTRAKLIDARRAQRAGISLVKS